MSETATLAPMLAPPPVVGRVPEGSPAQAALRQRLRDMYDDIADILDNDELERLPSYFLDDCSYMIISKENHDKGLQLATVYCDGVDMLHDRIMALRETQVYEPRVFRHFISGVRVLASDDTTVSARANFMVTEQMNDEEPRILMIGRYLDRLIRQGDTLMFKERLCVFDNYRIYRSLIAPV